MNDYLAIILAKIARQREKPLRQIASNAVQFAGDSATAATALRHCTRVGAGARSMGRPIVRNGGRIEIGRSVKLTNRLIPVELESLPGGVLVLGDEVTINYGTLLSASRRVTIGDRVMIGSLSLIADSETPGGDGANDVVAPIVIGDDAWLAVRVTVLPGSTIGAGAVITAGSVVSGEIPPGVVAGGIPARVLRASATARDRQDVSAPLAPTSPVPAQGANGTHPAAVRRVEHRGTLISDFTISDLATQLAALPDGPVLEAAVAPFGQVVQQLLQPPDEGAGDFAVVWTLPETVVPSFGRVRAGERVPLDVVLAEVDRYSELLAKGAAGYRYAFVPTWTLRAWDRSPALLDVREGGLSHTLAAMNARLVERLASSPTIHVLNAARWIAGGGRGASNPKAWYLGKVAFGPDAFAAAARDVQASIAALTGQARKLLVLDLDDTMWGGIVGDEGWENLRLGGHDGLGEAFVDFQRAVKALTTRGVVLGIVSKNTESVALEAIRLHPEMVLRETDFVGWRINWRDKAQNILDLTTQLRLGLQSVVFIDDNPVERARVRDMLPEVFVPEWPEDKYLYSTALAALRCFDVPEVSREDGDRTALYAAERERATLQASVGSMSEWLESLDIRVRAEPLAAHNLQRVVQLLNKTNQMNLATRRLSEVELEAWAAGPGRRLWALTVADKFGDAGLTGIVSVESEGGLTRVVDFVLSCRVMGRKVEDTMVHLAVEHARAAGASGVEAELLPTKKNGPCLAFWEGSGLTVEGGHRFAWDAAAAYPLPSAITLERTR